MLTPRNIITFFGLRPRNGALRPRLAGSFGN